jgi:AraC-like DNA-binding protein
MPYLWRLGGSFNYLVPACCYLYLRSILYDEVKLKKYDWLHFILAGLTFLDLLPFYFSALTHKQHIANAIILNNNLNFRVGHGVIPALWHFEISPFFGLIYIIFTWSMLLKYLYKRKLNNYIKVKYWLIVFCSFITIIYVNLIIRVFIILRHLDAHKDFHTLGDFEQYFMSFIFLGLNIYLFLNPEILYGMPILPSNRGIYNLGREIKNPIKIKQPITTIQNKKIFAVAVKEYVISEGLVLNYSKQLQSVIVEQQLFRQQGLTIHMLAEKSGISPRNVSYVLNQHHKQRFNDYINSYRINYMLMRFENNDWQTMSLEGLAMESGFSSRNTFLLAFKKNVGVPPSEYVEQLKKN